MCDSVNIADYIVELGRVLDESIEILQNLQHEAQLIKKEELVQVKSVVELVDMSYELAHSIRIKNAEFEFLQRQAN